MAAPSSKLRRGSTLLAGALYGGLSVLLWVHVWASHPTSVTTCGCGDAASTAWYLAWPAHAIAHGLDPLHSSAVGFPGGINMLSNTSVLAIGVPLAPVTWLFGPIVTLNVASTLAPALSALAMFLVLRRWVSWEPAAFVGGLFYGFSPFVLSHLAEGHLMVGMAFVPPLMLGCLDELLVRRRRRAVTVGLLLGLLASVEFFLSTELLLIMALMTAVGVVTVGIAALFQRSSPVRHGARRTLVGLSTAAGTAGALLAYPTWYGLAGPSHLSGPIWPGVDVSASGLAVRDLVVPDQHYFAPGISTSFDHVVGGYQGFLLSPRYFGFGLVLVLAIGMILWLDDRRLRFFGFMALLATLLAIGARYDAPLPYRLLARLPLFQNIVPGRFMLVTDLAVSVMLALLVQHVHGAVASGDWLPHRIGTLKAVALSPRLLAAGAGLVVTGLALGPVGAYLAQSMPYTTTPVAEPAWFRNVAPRLPAHAVLLVFPTPYESPDNPKVWQAEDGMHYAMAEQGGPGGVPQRAGKERAGQIALDAASGPTPLRAVQPAQVQAARRALDEWRVTSVVLPDDPGLPRYDRVPAVAATAAFLTAVTGEAPVLQDRSWVWTRIAHAPPPRLVSAAAFTRCAWGRPAPSSPAIGPAASCILRSP